MMPNYRDGWTIGKTDYMIYAPKGAKMTDKLEIEMALNEKLDSEAALMAFIKCIFLAKAVKCDDCEFFSTTDYEGRGYGMCRKTNQLMYEDEFCNLGERRENDGETD